MSGQFQHVIQGVDKSSGAIGAFIHGGDMAAISPVFPSVLGLYGWMSFNGWQCLDQAPSDGALEVKPEDFAVIRLS